MELVSYPAKFVGVRSLAVCFQFHFPGFVSPRDIFIPRLFCYFFFSDTAGLSLPGHEPRDTLQLHFPGFLPPLDGVSLRALTGGYRVSWYVFRMPLYNTFEQ